jgi:hypothetical protein
MVCWQRVLTGVDVNGWLALLNSMWWRCKRRRFVAVDQRVKAVMTCWLPFSSPYAGLWSLLVYVRFYLFVT